MLTSIWTKIINWFKRNYLDLLFILLILGIGVFVSFRNYVPGTWLIGWDDLLPELNFKLNIGRSFSAAWQEYQGLGLLGGMAHAADLPRQIFLWMASLILPTPFLRYFWTFLMLTVGPLGVYALLSKVLISKEADLLGKLAGFASAIFYLFNLATLQTFYTPFETFVSFYGFFPWLLYFALDFLKNGGRRKLLVYFLGSLLAAGAFYVQTLFVVYTIFLTVFALETIVRFGKDGILRSVKLGFVTLFVNAFWLLPVLYFSLTSASIPANSHINSIATPETQLMNMARADFKDIATLKGYWFDYYDWGQNGTYDYLYKNWINYTASPMVQNFSLALFFVSIAGLVMSIFKKKTPFGISILALFGISYFMLNGGQIPWIPFFSEIFRNAFTKWANAMALIYAVGAGLFVYIISDVFKNKLKYFLGSLISLFIVAACIFSVLPITKGELIAKSMRLSLPLYYLDTINYFKGQDPTVRIAGFPITDFWGWKFYDWAMPAGRQGYRGSGFLWYGIPQPMLDRAFDVWSPDNEAFYSEIAHAVEMENSDEIKYVLNKYQVGYILFDESIFEPGNTDSLSRIQKQKNLLESSEYISKAKEFGNITVYKVDLVDTINSFVTAPKVDFSSSYIAMGQTGGDLVVQETFPDTQGYQTPKNCDLKEQGTVIKTKTDGGNYYAVYDGGVSCDYFYYPTLDYSKAYSMRIKGKNMSGRSLKFYLYNVAKKRVDKVELLPNGDFDESYLILPTDSIPSAGLGYTLNVETRSFGRIASENILSKVEFYPVDTFKEMVFKGQQNDLKILGVRKYGTWAYKVDVEGDGVIQLGQGYDSGWVAITARDLPFTIYHLPFLEHVKVNSWSNGWVVNPSDCPELKTGNCELIIVYWPQLLEWGGIILGLIALILIVV